MRWRGPVNLAAAARGRWRSAAAWAVYGLLLGVGLSRHEMWRDEVQAWLMAYESRGLTDLLDWLVVEGHPAGWYLLLKPLTWISADPVWMQMLHGLIAAASAGLVLWASPFRWRNRVLLVFGYYGFYEYAVISRSYAAGVLGLYGALACYGRWLKHKGNTSLVAAAVCLLIAANTSVYGLMLAGALAVGLTADILVRRHREIGPGVDGKAAGVSAAVVLLGLAASAFQIGRYAVSDVRYGSRAENAGTQINPHALPAVMSNFVDALLPLPNFFYNSFWSNSLLRQPTWDGSAWLMAGIAGLWIVAIAVMLSRRPAACVTFLLGTGVLVLFSLTIYRGFYTRHLGHHFVVLVIACWLYRIAVPSGSSEYPPAKQRLLIRQTFISRRGAAWGWTALLTWHAAVGGVVWSLDLVRPFSDAPAAAAAISRHSGSPEPLVVTDLRAAASSVSAVLQRPVVFSDRGEAGRAIDWRRRIGDFDAVGLDQTLKRWLNTETARDQPTFLLTTPGPAAGIDGYQLTRIHEGPPAMSAGERFAVYSLSPTVEASKTNP